MKHCCLRCGRGVAGTALYCSVCKRTMAREAGKVMGEVLAEEEEAKRKKRETEEKK